MKLRWIAQMHECAMDRANARPGSGPGARPSCDGPDRRSAARPAAGQRNAAIVGARSRMTRSLLRVLVPSGRLTPPDT